MNNQLNRPCEKCKKVMGNGNCKFINGIPTEGYNCAFTPKQETIRRACINCNSFKDIKGDKHYKCIKFTNDDGQNCIDSGYKYWTTKGQEPKLDESVEKEFEEIYKFDIETTEGGGYDEVENNKFGEYMISEDVKQFLAQKLAEKDKEIERLKKQILEKGE